MIQNNAYFLEIKSDETIYFRMLPTIEVEYFSSKEGDAGIADINEDKILGLYFMVNNFKVFINNAKKL